MKYGIIAGTMMLLAFVIITGYIDDDSIKRYEVVDCELYGIAYITYLNEDGETATLYIQDWPRVILWDKTYLEYDVDSEEFTFYVHKEGFESLKKAHEENLRLLTIDNDRMEVYNSSDKIEILKKLPDVNLVEINNETYRIGFFNLTLATHASVLSIRPLAASEAFLSLATGILLSPIYIMLCSRNNASKKQNNTPTASTSPKSLTIGTAEIYSVIKPIIVATKAIATTGNILEMEVTTASATEVLLVNSS